MESTTSHGLWIHLITSTVEHVKYDCTRLANKFDILFSVNNIEQKLAFQMKSLTCTVYIYIYIYMLGAKHGFGQSMNCATQTVDL